MVKRITDVRNGLPKQVVKEAVEGFRLTNGQGDDVSLEQPQGNVVQPQQTEASEAMPQSTNATSETQTTTSPIDVKKQEMKSLLTLLTHSELQHLRAVRNILTRYMRN